MDKVLEYHVGYEREAKVWMMWVPDLDKYLSFENFEALYTHVRIISKLYKKPYRIIVEEEW